MGPRTVEIDQKSHFQTPKIQILPKNKPFSDNAVIKNAHFTTQTRPCKGHTLKFGIKLSCAPNFHPPASASKALFQPFIRTIFFQRNCDTTKSVYLYNRS